MSQDQPPREILLALLSSKPVSIATSEQWREVANLAQRHRVGPLLYRQIRTLEVTGQVPAEPLQELQSEYLRTASRNARVYHELSSLFERFQSANIQGILLKGAYLAAAVYGNIAIRSIGDVDLLVRKSDLAQVDGIMKTKGFKCKQPTREMLEGERHFVYIHMKNGLMIEVHWDLIDSRYRVAVDIDGLWQRSRPARVADIPVQALAPEDQVLHLCIHTSEHVFETGLFAICDLAQTLLHYQEILDWDSLCQRACSWKAERCVYVTLRLAKELLKASVPDDWLNALQPVDFDPLYMEIAREHLFDSKEGNEAPPLAWHRIVEFWMSGSLRRKFSLLWRRVFLSRQAMAIIYSMRPDSLLIFLYYPIRLMKLLSANIRAIWQLQHGNDKMLILAGKQKGVNALRSWLLPVETRR